MKVNKLFSLSFSSSLSNPSIWQRVPMFMHLPRLLAGLSEKTEGLFFFLFSFSFFSCAISCLQKPLTPIQHQHQGTALMSILATDLFLSPLPAALSLSLSFLYPPSSLPLPFARSLRLLYNQIIKRIVDKMILPGN